MRRLAAIFLCIVLLAGVTSGCGNLKKEKRRIAVITDYTTVEEDVFYVTIWNAAKEIADREGIPCTAYTTSDETYLARKETIERAIQEGTTLVVLPSSNFGGVLSEVQFAHPEVKFLAIDVGEGDMIQAPQTNIYACAFREEEVGFLAGYATVREGYHSLGFLGGVELPSIKRFCYGYIQGADMAANELMEDINIKYSYAGQFYGDLKIAEQMNKWYDEGTEVVFSCGGGIYTSVVEAAVSHEGMVIGVDVDQGLEGHKYSYNPFLTSAMKGIKEITTEVVEHYVNDSWDVIGGKIQTLGLAEGNYVGLPMGKESWQFEKFTHGEYDNTCKRIINKEIVISNDVTKLPEVSAYTSIIED